jgi:hypothetical protein
MLQETFQTFQVMKRNFSCRPLLFCQAIKQRATTPGKIAKRYQGHNRNPGAVANMQH